MRRASTPCVACVKGSTGVRIQTGDGEVEGGGGDGEVEGGGGEGEADGGGGDGDAEGDGDTHAEHSESPMVK